MGKKRNKKLLGKIKNKKKSTKRLSRNDLKNKLEMVKRNVEDEFQNDDKDKYELVMDSQELYEYLNNNNIYALDTESDVVGNNPDPIDDTITGFSLYSDNLNPIYVPINHKKTHLINFNYQHDYKNQLKDKEIKDIFKSVDCKFVFHNAVYDARVFINFINYFDLDTIHWDTYLGSRYLNETDKYHNLKYLYDRYIEGRSNQVSSSFKDLFKDTPFHYVPIELARLYGGKDALMTYKLFKFQEQFLDPESEKSMQKDLADAGKFYVNTEVPLIPVITEMEERGMKIDKQFAKELSKEHHEKVNKIEKKIHDFLDSLDYSSLSDEKMNKLDDPLNLNSPAQLVIIIYDVLGLEHEDGNTAVGTLEDLKEKTQGDIKEFFNNLLEYRSQEKLLDTFIDKLPKTAKKDGRVHAKFNQYGADTGRFSSSNPNLQNIPKSAKKVRQMFTAGEGKILLCSDYSQQEVRILAHISQDDNMIKAYQNDRDLYSWVASMVYDVEYETCLKGGKNQKYRTNLKSVILGLMYGRSTGSVAEQLGISYDRAEEIENQFFNRFPNVKRVIEEEKKKCEKRGYIKTVLGRKRRLPDMQLPDYEISGGTEKQRQKYLQKLRNTDYYKKVNKIKRQIRNKGLNVKDNTYRKQEAGRQVLNSIIQGSAADMTKIAMVKIYNNDRLQKLGYDLLLPVHDEVIGERDKEPVDKVKETIKIVEELMEEAGYFVDVPMKVDTDIQRRWNGKEIEL